MVCVLPSIGDAAEIVELETSHRNGEYGLEMTVGLSAPRDRVLDVLTDYATLSELNPSIVEVMVLAADDPDVTRVRTRIKRCVLFYCPELVRVEDVRNTPEGGLNAVLVPALSDFSSGEASWAFVEVDGLTQVSYQARFRPDFWVPPLIGPAIIRGALEEEARILFENVERRAQAEAP